MSSSQTVIIETGSFYCPQCHQETDYRLNEVTAYQLPDQAKPMYVECQRCHATFKHSMLNNDQHFDAAEFEAEYLLAIREVMLFMAQAGQSDDPDEIAKVLDIYRHLTGNDLDETVLNDELAHAADHQDELFALLDEIAPYLNHIGRVSVFEAAVFVAAANGEFDPNEQELAIKIAYAIGMDQHEILTTMDEIQHKKLKRYDRL